MNVDTADLDLSVDQRSGMESLVLIHIKNFAPTLVLLQELAPSRRMTVEILGQGDVFVNAHQYSPGMYLKIVVRENGRADVETVRDSYLEILDEVLSSPSKLGKMRHAAAVWHEELRSSNFHR